MLKLMGLLLCAVSLAASARAASADAEIFVIRAAKSGREATVTIPVSAVTKLSANSAQSLEGYAGSQVEAMRLSGDVLISIEGSKQPIQIKADAVVLELTADVAPGRAPSLGRSTRADAAANKLLRSTTSPGGEETTQTFVGNVVFDLQTTAGPMQIKADRVEHQLQSEAGA